MPPKSRSIKKDLDAGDQRRRREDARVSVRKEKRDEFLRAKRQNAASVMSPPQVCAAPPPSLSTRGEAAWRPTCAAQQPLPSLRQS